MKAPFEVNPCRLSGTEYDLPIMDECNKTSPDADREVRTQYRLAYYPNPRGPANTYRSIFVTVTPDDCKVHHRKSYLTGPQ